MHLDRVRMVHFKERESSLPRRDPYIVDAPLLQAGDMLLEAHPMLLIGWDVPLESLHHRHVLRSSILDVLPHFDGYWV